MYLLLLLEQSLTLGLQYVDLLIDVCSKIKSKSLVYLCWKDQWEEYCCMDNWKYIIMLMLHSCLLWTQGLHLLGLQLPDTLSHRKYATVS